MLSKPAGVKTTNTEEQMQRIELVFGLMFSHLDAARNQCQEQFPMRGHYTITDPGLESSTSRTCAKTLNREGSIFQLCLSSSAKTPMMKNYRVYRIKR